MNETRRAEIQQEIEKLFRRRAVVEILELKAEMQRIDGLAEMQRIDGLIAELKREATRLAK